MPRINRVRALAAGLLGATALVAVPLSQAADASASGTYEHAVRASTNVQRVDNDRAKLRYLSCLDRYAERQARRMASQQRMYHQDLGPILRDCKVDMVGENVAYGYANGKAAVNAWMNSPGHRANILNKGYKLMAIGAVQDRSGRWYVAQVFGRAA